MMTTDEFKNEARRLRPRLMLKAHHYLSDGDEAEDVVQDVLLRLWQMCSRLHAPVEPLALLLTRNLCVDLLRRRRPTSDVGLLQAEADTAADNPCIERMMRVVETLPDWQQTILRLRHMQGMDMKEIASLTGSNEVAIRKALSRARQAVRDKYKKNADNE
jgi:RNA polymerase sigma-70 factor (ECF subfamily)